VKIAENCDHNIDPWPPMSRPWAIACFTFEVLQGCLDGIVEESLNKSAFCDPPFRLLSSYGFTLKD
jgi:hypothetical protein